MYDRWKPTHGGAGGNPGASGGFGPGKATLTQGLDAEIASQANAAPIQRKQTSAADPASPDTTAAPGPVASSGGRAVQRKPDPAGSTDPTSAAVSELPNLVDDPGSDSIALPDGAARAPAVQAKPSGAPIQAHSDGGPIQRQAAPGKKYLTYQVRVTRPMTQDEFRIAAMQQIFGRVLDQVEWKNSLASYDPEHSPYTVQVDAALWRQQRGATNKNRDIAVDPDGGVTGAKKRAQEFDKSPASDQKSALLDEVNRRYHQAVGDAPGTAIKPGDSGKQELWRSIRDELLFEYEAIRNLPPQVKQLIKFVTGGKELTPADYDKLFAIIKKIESLPAGQIGDYASKVTGTTSDLNAFEASLDKYIAQMATRAAQDEQRDGVQTKLVGLEEVYKKYQLYRTLLSSGSTGGLISPYGAGAGLVVVREAEKLRQELDAELPRYGFAGVSEFEAFIKKFEDAFELASASIANDVLGKYAGALYREAERYKNPSELAGLRQALTSGAAAGDHAILQDEGLPEAKRINRAALARASDGELAGLIQTHLQTRRADITAARAEIEGKPALIYKMDKLLPVFYAQQGIQPGSIHDLIIRDRMREDAILKLTVGLALAIIAVALAVVTLGAATPAILAAGTALTGAGLGAYMAIDEYRQYAQDKKLADAGLADDPSMVWVIVAVVGAGLDMAGAVKAVRALGPAAKALNAGGDLGEFTKAVRALEKAHELETSAARAAEKAAAARVGFGEASSELTRALSGKLYSFPGPLADPEVYKAVVHMARQAVRAKLYDAQKFIDELKLARVKAGFSDLSPEELVKAKQAWQEAKALEASETAARDKLLQQIPDATRLDALVAKAGDATKLDRLLQVFPEAELEAIFAQLKDTRQLAVVLDRVGAENGAKMIRQWIAKGNTAKMTSFIDNLAGSGAGATQLGETAAVGAKEVIIDSQTAIALAKDAAGTPLQAGEQAMVNYVKSLPLGTELRVGNITVGEVGSKAINVRGLPLEVTRESATYKQVIAELERMNVGGGKGAADRALVADAFLAKTEPGVVPRFATADKNVFNKLATEAGIDLTKMAGKKLSELHPGGFEVTVAGQKLHVVPIE
jgi:hypothetical protein